MTQSRLPSLAFLVLFACADSPSDTKNTLFCAPGITRLCQCDNGQSGAQSCSDEGANWLGCECVGESNTSTTADKKRNILLLIADDLGVDASMCYGHDQAVASTPVIKSLCDRGVVFKNAWSNPVCSPTRASMLTGRYSFRTGVGAQVMGMQTGISLSETTIPKLLSQTQSGYRHANIGKWHLSDNDNGNGDNPNLMGYDHFSGLLTGGTQSYERWRKTVNGETSTSENYLTTDNVDDAIAWLNKGEEEPWFLWLAFVAPHAPFHLPPANLHHHANLSGSEDDINSNPLPYYQAMIEAMDTELGRLLAAIGPEALANTEIIYIGDNGSPGQVNQTTAQRQRAKNTLYKGGVHVPLIIAGPSVVDGGREESALVNDVDVFSTVLELAGVDINAAIPSGHVFDSMSLLPLIKHEDMATQRPWIFTELFGPEVLANRSGTAISDGHHKLIRFDQAGDVLYNIDSDPEETTDLLGGNPNSDAQAAYDKLSQALEALLASP